MVSNYVTTNQNSDELKNFKIALHSQDTFKFLLHSTESLTDLRFK